MKFPEQLLEVHHHFKEGIHTIRQSDRHCSETTGGLTRDYNIPAIVQMLTAQ